MKRFHLNLTVRDLDRSIAFYSTLFDQDPTVKEVDYAKWMLDDPFINLSISTRGDAAGVNHVGIQANDEEELALIRGRLVKADAPILDQEAVTCCYANSKKAWISDPDGVSWETFLTHGRSTTYGEGTDAVDAALKPAAEKTAKACCGT